MCTYTPHPAFIPLGSFWLTVPAPERDYDGKEEGGWGPVEGWGVLRLEQQRVRKRVGGLGPVSFINLNVYTSWSLAMRPFSFPQVSPSRICGPLPASPESKSAWYQPGLLTILQSCNSYLQESFFFLVFVQSEKKVWSLTNCFSFKM